MGTPSLPILMGSGIVIGILFAITGFALAVRTETASWQVALFVGGLTALGVGGMLVHQYVRVSIVALSYAIMLFFPVYALYSILRDFVERVVRA